MGHPFKPGQSGNPAGRPKSLARKTRELVGEDGEPLVRLWLAIMNDAGAKPSERIEASKLLADRGWGKAVDVRMQDEEDPLGLTDARERLVGKLAQVAAAIRAWVTERHPELADQQL